MNKNLVLLISVLTSFLFLGVGFAQPKMNEIYSRGVAGNLDWIEIYNGSTSPLDISGYKIYDIGGQSGTKPKKLFPTGTIMPAKGFYVIITDTADFPGDLSGFGLSSAGETVWFENSSGALLDSITFPAMGTTQSYGRLPDGGVWQLLNTITRGISNIPSGLIDELSGVPEFVLYQNYPNPFNPVTRIDYQLPFDSKVTIELYGMTGERIATLINGELAAGYYTTDVNASALNLSSGVYIYRMTAQNPNAQNFVQVKKLMLTK